MAERPFVLIVGDSISMGYAPIVKQYVSERLDVDRIPPNGGDSANVLAHLDEWVGARPAAAVHFNCGLHDLKRNRATGTCQQAVEAYVGNLKEIVRYLKEETAARLIWATTTPVIEGRHNKVKDFDRFHADVRAYNAAALEVMKAGGVETNDLHAAIEAAGPEDCLCEDGVHMTPKGNAVLALAVARLLIG